MVKSITSNDKIKIILSCVDQDLIVYITDSFVHFNTTQGSSSDHLTSPPTCCSINGRKVLVCLQDSTILYYDLLQGSKSELTGGINRTIGWINDCAIGNTYAATIGDDKLARIYSIGAQELMNEIELSSFGVSISFQPSNPGKVMTAEINGTIIVWDIETSQRLKSFNLGERLVYCDWNPIDDNVFGSIVEGNWAIVAGNDVVAKGITNATKFKWSEKQVKMFALGGNEIKVYPNHFTSSINL